MMFNKEPDPSLEDYQTAITAAQILNQLAFKLVFGEWQCVKDDLKNQHILTAQKTIAKDDRFEAEKEFKLICKQLTEALGF